MNLHSTKFKIISATLLCVVLVGITSNALLYNYLNEIIMEKAERIENWNLETTQRQIEQRLNDVVNLGLLCANDGKVARAMEFTSLNTLLAKRACQSAQETMNTYLRASAQVGYINKLVVFNGSGLFVQGQGNISGSMHDYETIAAGDMYKSFVETATQPYALAAAPALNKNTQAIALLGYVGGVGAKGKGAYVYIEMDMAIVMDILRPFSSDLNTIFMAPVQGDSLVLAGAAPGSLIVDLSSAQDGDVLYQNGQNYQLRKVPLAGGAFMLLSYTNLTALSRAEVKISYTAVVLGITCILISIGLAIILSNYITRPMNRLINRIKRISANDFSYDPAIEQSKDEMGEIGRVVNEMTLSIEHLLKNNEAMYTQRQNIEISLLQSQVNPHFLYNTLDSIHWMAVIQKNQGVANMTRSLVNLLKNIAKGTQSKISLREEVELLKDYVAIQAIRYLETFEFVVDIPEELYQYRIIKLTLQPLVENAIFHGIEPTGMCGTITLSAKEEGADILLQVQDNGAGIPEDILQSLMSRQGGKGKESLNGIGVSNVHTRLQLTYGKEYGLSVESRLGEFTRVVVRIPKEE